MEIIEIIFIVFIILLVSLAASILVGKFIAKGNDDDDDDWPEGGYPS